MKHRAEFKLSTRTRLLFSVVFSMTWVPVSFSQELPHNVHCYQQDTEIFVSDTGSIDTFDAAAYGASLTQIIPAPEQNMSIYVFSPGQIICAVKADAAEADTSSENSGGEDD